MRVMIWVWKHVPFAAFLWFKVIFRVWSGLIANLEAIWWWRAGRDARLIMPLLLESIDSAAGLVDWYLGVGFTWRSDPVGGLLDYHSKPWVSVAKKYGDCDDMAALAAFLLRSRYEKARRVIVYSSTGEGHVVLMLSFSNGLSGESWVCVSNKSATTFPTFDEAVRSTYGDRTVFWYAY